MEQIVLGFSATETLINSDSLLLYALNEEELIDDMNLDSQPPPANADSQDANLRLTAREPSSNSTNPVSLPLTTHADAVAANGTLSRKARKRKAYKSSAGYKEQRAQERRFASQNRLADSIAANSLQLTTHDPYSLLPKSSNTSSGSHSQSVKDEIDLLLKNPTFRLAMLKTFRPIPYRPRSVVHVYGRDKALLALRTFRDREISTAYMVDLMQCVDRLATACRVVEPHSPHQRGHFAQIRIGWNHGMGEGENMPYRLALHADHQQDIDKFLASDSVKLAIRVGNELFKKYFPKAAIFLNELDDFWKKTTKGHVSMEFGFFYTMAINIPITREVKAIPHIDGRNIAFCPCAILPIGFFPSDVRAWFVNHSLRLIFQVPTGVWTYTLSSLIIHYNADTQEFMAGGAPVKLVTNSDYEWPTATNTTPLNGIGTGRGSIVLYNQASFIHWHVTGEQYLYKAEEVHGGIQGLRALFAAKAEDVLQYQE